MSDEGLLQQNFRNMADHQFASILPALPSQAVHL